MIFRLNNDILELTADTHGAEIFSVKRDGTEYIWNGDPAYWGRRTPVLFPFVGQVRGGVYRHKGIEYRMGQHGFARDQEFELYNETKDSLTFILRENEKTLAVYPFRFELFVTYVLKGDAVTVEWKVRNPGDGPLHFSIGGHAAFMCPIGGTGTWADYAIELRKDGSALDAMVIRPIRDGGNVGNETKEIPLKAGRITPSDELFAGDALILENSQADEISLVNPEGNAYLTVNFDTPLVGIWSPVGKHAPFICIEPWCGRTDSTDFAGELAEREYGNTLEPGGEFVRAYTIRFHRNMTI